MMIRAIESQRKAEVCIVLFTAFSVSHRKEVLWRNRIFLELITKNYQKNKWSFGCY